MSDDNRIASKVGFSSLPSELIVRILCYLPNLDDILNAGQVTREINLCSQEFTVWRTAHRNRWTRGKKTQHLTANDWNKDYIRRHQLDLSVDDSVEKLIHQPEPPSHARIPRYRQISDWGVDAKDRLLHHINCRDDIEDVLARRYWARSMLKSHYRRHAVMTWRDIEAGQDVPLEKALSTFEMFFRQDGNDSDSISEWLDKLAAEFEKETRSIWATLGTRDKALQLAHWMVAMRNFVGPHNEDSYYDVCNNFIGYTLQNPRRPGLPLIYAAVFCALAQRMGLDAKPCSFPLHVYAIVQAPEGKDLSGNLTKTRKASQDTRMFLDLYLRKQDIEVSESELRLDMERIPGIPLTLHDQYLQPADTKSMVIRTRQNLMQAIQHAHNMDPEGTTANGHFLSHHREELLYAVVWMTMIFDGGDGPAYERRRTHVNYLMRPLETDFFADWYLFDEVVMPTFNGTEAATILHQHLAEIRQKDLAVPSARYRTPEFSEKIEYRIGTCFVHQKYGYTGFIIGWDSACSMPEPWQAAQRIDSLKHGRGQCFYNVISEDGVGRYVAQENIGPTPVSGPPDAILRIAGKYFLRWENQTRRFVSNLKAHYPDD